MTIPDALYKYPKFSGNSLIQKSVVNRNLSDSLFSWLSKVLEKDFANTTFNIECIRSRPWSNVYSVLEASKNGPLLKLPNYIFRNESRLTLIISSQYPRQCVKIIAEEPVTGAFLVHSFGKYTLRHLLRERFDMELPVRAIKTYALMQASSQQLNTALLNSGAPDWRAANVYSEMQRAVASKRFIASSKYGNSASAIIESHGREIKHLCNILVQAGNLETFDHGDFQDNNIFVDGPEFVFGDWADLNVTHPFFSLATFCHSFRLAHNDANVSPDSVAMLIREYSDIWSKTQNNLNIEEILRVTNILYPAICLLKTARLLDLNQDSVDTFTVSLMDYWLEVLLGLLTRTT